MSNIIWQPSLARIQQSNLYHFINFVNKKFLKQFEKYRELYQWSITEPENFWTALWEFCDIKAYQKWDKVLEDPNKMPGATWFVGAKINFAENLLRHQENKIALIFRNENGLRRTLTYPELNQQVSLLAQALRNGGIKKGDRVAAVMPNMPETVIAMLAATSIGAVWSSCAPEFGVNALVDRLGQITPRILFITDGYFYNGKSYEIVKKINSVIAKVPSIEQVIVVPYVNTQPNISQLKNAFYYQDLIKKSDPAIPLQFDPTDFNHPVYILYSSGTTGAPKCIVHGAGGTLIQHLKELVLHTDLKANDIIFYYTTCGWMMWNWYISSLAVGATLVLYDGAPLFPQASAMFDLIDCEKITIFGASAKFISAIEKSGIVPRDIHSLNSLRTILTTGSPLLPMNFDFVYQKIKTDVALCSISGGTDIISCFALGNPLLPVYRGELQSRGLGLNVQIFNQDGKPVCEEKGELVCTAPFPSMPIYFWNDPSGEKYHHAYFAKFPHVWAHGDYAEITSHDGVIIYGRSDAVLNPGGIRIGTAEIYHEVEKIPEVVESIVVDQRWQGDTRIILFVKLQSNLLLTAALQQCIKQAIRTNASPHHVPAKIIQVLDIPHTMSGKIVEMAVRDVINGDAVKNISVLANPEALDFFRNIPELNQE